MLLCFITIWARTASRIFFFAVSCGEVRALTIVHVLSGPVFDFLVHSSHKSISFCNVSVPFIRSDLCVVDMWFCHFATLHTLIIYFLYSVKSW